MHNNVNLIGRLTKDPEIVVTESNKKVCNIVLAVQRNYKNADGIYEADFIKCTLWDGIADRITEYSHKGDLVAVRGWLKVTVTTKDDGDKRYNVEVIVDKLSFLSSKNNIEKE